MFKRITIALAIAAALTVTPLAQAASDQSCGKIQFANVNWTGVSIKTATAAWILEELGYETETTAGSVSIVLQSVANGDSDAFLGLWLPSQRGMVRKHMSEGNIDIVTRNLDEAKYTVAVSEDAWNNGVTHFRDLAENADRFDSTIFGIEAGNEGNGFIMDMINDDVYGMGGFTLQPSSEAGMLTAVKNRHQSDEWAAWLAWAPHPMTLNFDMKFLDGGEDYFGPNQGGASVYTLAREGFAWQCPNVGQFLENFQVTVDEQSRMAGYVLNDDMGNAAAGRKLASENPELLDRWLGRGGTYQTGPVKSADGSTNGIDIVREALGM